MTKKINISLGAKVFLLTFLLLLSCNFTVCLLISIFTPQTYSAYLTNALNEKVSEFLLKAENIPMKDRGALFKGLLANPDILSVSLLDETGNEISLLPKPATPADTSTVTETTIFAEAVTVSDSPDSYTLQNFDISFADQKGYTLLVYGNSEPVYQLQETLNRLFPLLLFLLTLVSLLFSFFYSRIVTRLQKDIEKEKQLEQERLAFFSAASHELKTPVTIIKGQLEGMLLNVGVYKNREKYLARSLEITNTLEIMIQELLTSSRLDTPDYCLAAEPVSLKEITKKCLSLTEDLLINRELTIHLDIKNSHLVIGDKILLEKVIDNLISNAVFYSPEGNDIFICIENNNRNVLFYIENTGVHLPENILPRIFEAFYRGEQSRNRQMGGSGLGLYIVQKILKIHKSTCIVQNTERGVCFSFSLPCAESKTS